MSSGSAKAMKALYVILDILIALVVAFYYIIERIVLLLVPVSWRAKRVAGDVVLITGGGSGLGRLFAKSFAKLECIIVVWDINKQGNDETAKMITNAGGKAFAYTCDISDREAVYATAEKVKREVGPVSILVNNAGIVTGKNFLECPDNMIQKTFDVNTLAVMWTCKAFLPDMISRSHGHIVNVASMAGMVGCNGLADYSASKFATVGFSESLLMELRNIGQHDIKITLVCPFFINTGMFDGVRSKIFPIMEPDYVVKKSMQAILTNEEVVLIPSFLMNITMLLRCSLTWNGGYAVGKAMGLLGMMENFKGRPKAPVPNMHND